MLGKEEGYVCMADVNATNAAGQTVLDVASTFEVRKHGCLSREEGSTGARPPE